ncbi:MAG: beta/gamma crystallin-related protein [Burkholderiaceae bacterium]
MKKRLLTLIALGAAAIASQASAQITFYERDGFHGRSFSTTRPVGNFDRVGFNDRASSVIVDSDRWEVCEDARYRGRCVVLRRGNYPDLASMGLNDRVSSVRLLPPSARVEDSRYAPPPVSVYDGRRRQNERLFEAQVLSVRAVVGPPEQRCWMEREQVTQDRSQPNVGGAIAGAVIGGILGHQFGGGSGRDLATAGGVIAGGALGANAGRGDSSRVVTQDVQRCSERPGDARPDYWDVTYEFRGQQHRMQTTSPPGATVTVNGRGEPRAT